MQCYEFDSKGFPWLVPIFGGCDWPNTTHRHPAALCILLCFMFWDIVHFARCANKKPGSHKGQEIRSGFVGFAVDVGHALTFLVLTDDT